MATLNKVFLLGNLTRDPDFRNIPSGSAVCDFGLAVTRRFYAANGEQQDETCFVDITVWGKSAENCNKYLSKGSKVMIEGRLKLDQWEDQNGGKRSKLKVLAETVQFMGGKREDNGDNQPQAQPEQSPHRGIDSSYAPPPMPEVPEDNYDASDDIPF